MLSINRESRVIIGDDEVQQLFKMAPRTFANSMAKWMWRERRSFVGTKKHHGAFRRSLLRKPKKYGDGTWSEGIPRAFTGKVFGPKRIENMTLVMGVEEKWLKKMPYVEALGKGATIVPKSKKWLMIPHYQNLKGFGRVGGHGKRTYSDLMQELQAHLDQPFLFHGKLLVFGDTPKGEERGHLHRKLLFVGVKQAKIKRQFNFEGHFNRRVPGMIKRANNAVKRTVRDMNRGYAEVR